jgi:hypothetical protein
MGSMGTGALDNSGTRSSTRMPHVLRFAPWLAGLLLLAGGIAAIVRYAPDRDPAAEVFSKAPARIPVKQKSVSLSADAKRVAQRFVQTAVARQNLAEAWNLVGPNLRGGLTRKEWLRGDIPVVPYPVSSLEYAPFKIDYSYRTEALLEVALVAKKSAKVKPQIFFLTLKQVTGPGGKRRWIADNWVPRTAILVPRGND